MDTFAEEDIVEKYGVKPKQLIEVKGLMGDTSDNIPGVPGVGEKTALELIKKYESIDKLYEAIENNTDDIKAKTKEKLIENKDLALLSRTLGTINVEVPLAEKVEDLKLIDWDNEKLFTKFKELNFNRFIERFDLQTEKQDKNVEELVKIENLNVVDINIALENNNQEFIYLLDKENVDSGKKIIKKRIDAIGIYNKEKNTSYYK